MSGETGTEVRREEALQCVERQGQRCGEQARGRSRVASRARDMSRQHASNRHATAHDMSRTDARGVPRRRGAGAPAAGGAGGSSAHSRLREQRHKCVGRKVCRQERHKREDAGGETGPGTPGRN